MAEPLRALFINEGSLGPDVMGHAQAGATLSASLADSGLDVAFLTLPPMPGATRLAVRGVPGLQDLDLDLQAVRWQLVQAVRARRVLDRALRRRPPDVVHVHGHTLGLLMAPQMRRLPIVLSVDATVWDWHAMGIWRSVRGWSRRVVAPSLRLERRAFSAAWRVAAYTRWTADAVRREAPDARIVELHPGVDLERWRPEPREPRERPRALFVGGRFAAKGGDDLLAVARPLLGEALELDIVTAAPVPEETGVRVHRLQPNDPALVRLYRQADVFVLPTYGDAVPWAVLEALACGVPVVAYDVGAIGELLDHGRAGVLIERGDRDGLRSVLGELLADPGRRDALGRAGRAHVAARYNGRVQSERLIQLLRTAGEEAPAA